MIVAHRHYPAARIGKVPRSCVKSKTSVIENGPGRARSRWSVNRVDPEHVVKLSWAISVPAGPVT